MHENIDIPLRRKPDSWTVQELIEALERERSQNCSSSYLSKVLIALKVAKGFRDLGMHGLQRAILDA